MDADAVRGVQPLREPVALEQPHGMPQQAAAEMLEQRLRPMIAEQLDDLGEESGRAVQLREFSPHP